MTMNQRSVVIRQATAVACDLLISEHGVLLLSGGSNVHAFAFRGGLRPRGWRCLCVQRGEIPIAKFFYAEGCLKVGEYESATVPTLAVHMIRLAIYWAFCIGATKFRRAET